MLEVLMSVTLVSLLSLSLIQGGVYLQRESKRTEQSLLAMHHIENYLEYARAVTITGSALELDWQEQEGFDIDITLSSERQVSSQGVKGTKIEVTGHWINPWGQSESIVISTWIAFH